MVVGGLFFILTPRLLGAVNYGLFSTVVAIGLLTASVANFGIDTGILKFAKQDDEKSQKVFSLAFKLYLVFGITTSILGIFLASTISRLLNHPELSHLLQIAFSSTIFLLLTNFFVSSLQSQKQFAKATLVNLSSNLARIVILIISSMILTISLNIVTTIFFFVTIVSVVVGKALFPLHLQPTSKKDLTNFLKFNTFVAASLIVSSIPFDNLFLLKIAGPLQTGLYAAPFKFLTFAYQFGGNFSKVIGINLTHAKNKEDLKTATKNAAVLVLLFILGLGLALVLSPIINSLFGREFVGSLQILQILILGFVFFFLSIIPSAIILYHFGKSEISFLITLIKYVFYVTLLLLLVPSLEAQGAAWAFSLSEFLSFLLMSSYAFKKLSRLNGN